MSYKFIIAIFLLAFSFQYNTFDASNLKSTSDNPNNNYDASQYITNFNVEMIKYYSWFASYGYCKDEEISSGSCCKSKNLLNNNWKIVSHNNVKNPFSFSYNWVLLKSDKFKKYIIAVPGTREKLQLVLEAVGSDLDSYNGDENIRISNYFLSLYNDFDQDLFSANNLKEIKNHPDYQIIITGHSLGGAVASIIAFAIKKEKIFTNNLVLITYGQPRTGNYYFADYVTKNVNKIFRIVRKGDMVVTIPLYTPILGGKKKSYYHIGGMIVLNKEMNEFTQCEYNKFEEHTGICKYQGDLDFETYHNKYFSPNVNFPKRCKD
jgi:hypothetical protein